MHVCVIIYQNHFATEHTLYLKLHFADNGHYTLQLMGVAMARGGGIQLNPPNPPPLVYELARSTRHMVDIS